MLVSPSMTWLLVSTSPVEVITMPVPAALPPLKVMLTLTMPGVTLAATADVSGLPVDGLVAALPPLLPESPLPRPGLGRLGKVVAMLDDGEEDVSRPTATPTPMPTTKRLTSAAATTRRPRVGRCGNGCHAGCPLKPDGGADGGGGGGGAAAPRSLFCTPPWWPPLPCNKLTRLTPRPPPLQQAVSLEIRERGPAGPWLAHDCSMEVGEVMALPPRSAVVSVSGRPGRQQS